MYSPVYRVSFFPHSASWLLLACCLISLTMFACGSTDNAPTDQDGDCPNCTDGDTIDGDMEASENDQDSPVDGDTANPVLNEIDCQGRDWVEIANPSKTKSLDLSGWILTDKPSDKSHDYAFPQGTRISPRDHFVIKAEDGGEAGFTFGIKCGSDELYLLTPDRDEQDQTSLPDLPDDITWGRLPDMEGPWRQTLPTQGKTNVPTTEDSGLLFDPLNVFTIELTLSEASIQALSQNPNDYVEGSISVSDLEQNVDETTIGIRLKGGLSYRPLGQKASFKLGIDEIIESNRLLGLRNLTLNSMVDDPTMLHETLAYELFRLFNVPAPRTGYAWVRVNGEDYGLYSVVERYDDLFLSDAFSSSQHLYEGSIDLYVGQEEDFEIDEGDKDDIGDLKQLVQAIHNSSDDTWYGSVSGLADLDEIIRMWVVENYIGHFDGYAQAHNNYYLHSDASSRFSMLPWGTDRAFTQSPDFPSGSSVIVSKCAANTECRARYDVQLQAFIDAIEPLDLQQRIDELHAAIQDSVQSDPMAPSTLAEHQQAMQALSDFLPLRKTAAQQSLQNR